MIVCLSGLAEVAMARSDWAGAVRVLEEGRGYAAEGLSGNWAEMMLMPLGRARAGLGDLDGGRSDLERGVHIAGRQRVLQALPGADPLPRSAAMSTPASAWCSRSAWPAPRPRSRSSSVPHCRWSSVAGHLHDHGRARR